MSSERLEKYEEELKIHLEELQSAVSYQIPSKYGDDRRRTVLSIERRLSEAEGLLQDVQRESRSAPYSYQHEISGRVAVYRASLASLRRQMGNGSLREELFSREEEDTYDPKQAERELLLKKTHTLKRASESLHRAQNITADTDEIAIEVMGELGEQKETLRRTRGKVLEIDKDMDKTKSLLRTLVCKGIENRILLVIVIIIELLILVGVTYWKFFS